MTFSNRWRSWKFLLPVIHVLIASTVVVVCDLSWWKTMQRDDVSHIQEQRDERARQQRIERKRAEKRWFAEGPTVEERNEAHIFEDYYAPRSTKIIAYLDYPAYVLVGWYNHRLTQTSYPLLWPLLGLVADSMSLGKRALVLDILFLLAVAMQWWLLGLILDSQEIHRRFYPNWRSVAGVIILAWIAVTWVLLRGGCLAMYSKLFPKYMSS